METSPTPPQTEKDYCKEMKKLRREGQTEAAQSLLGEAEEKFGPTARIHCSRGEILRALGRYTEARECFHQALALEPNDPVVINSIGQSYVDVGNLEKGRDYFTLSLRGHPGDDVALHSIAQTYLLEKRWMLAIQAFEALLAISPYDARGLMGKGHSIIMLGKRQEGLQYLLQAHEKNPADTTVMRDIGRFYATEKKYKEAKQWFDKALALNPRDIRILYEKMKTCRRSGDTAGALDCSRKILEVDPSNEQALSFVVQTLLPENRVEEAKKLIIQRLQKPPIHPGILRLLALCVGDKDPIWDALRHTVGEESVRTAQESALSFAPQIERRRSATSNSVWRGLAAPVNSFARRGFVQ